jgi:hypothetical protein
MGRDIRTLAASRNDVRARAQGELERVRMLKMRITVSFYEMGEALGRILDDKLYVALGYASFVDLLHGENLLGPTQAKKLIAVRKSFDRDQALRVGPERAYALTRYVARTKTAASPSELVEKGFPLAGRRTPVEQMPVRKIDEAGRAFVERRRGPDGESARARADAESERRHCLAELRARGVDGAIVHKRRTKNKWTLVIVVPAEQARGALRAKR